MPDYIYKCLSCEKKFQNDHANDEWSQEEYDTKVLFETIHRMQATESELKDALKCPRCSKSNAERFYGYDNITAYIRGNGFLDKAGAKRDMHLHTLETKDPYAEMRQPGEVDELKSKLKRAGTHDPKPQHYVVNDKPK